MKEDKRPEAVKKFQKNLKQFKSVAKIDGPQLANILGCTKQNICQIEYGKIRMSIPQYIAIRTIFEYQCNERLNDLIHELVDDTDEYWLVALVRTA